MEPSVQQAQNYASTASRAHVALLDRAWLAPVIVFAASAALHLYSLMHLPFPFVDEGWNANRSWALLHTGRAFGTLDSGVFEQYEGYWTYFPWLAAAIHAMFEGVFGPTLFALRLSSFLFGIALLWAIYVIAQRLINSRAALLAVGLVSLSLPFFYSSHLGRHDIIVTAMGFGAIALYLTDEGKGFTWKSILSGLLVSLAMDIHMNAVVFGPALLGLYVLDERWGVFRSRRFWGFALGAAVGIAYFLVIHVLQYPQTYFTLFTLGNGASRTPPLLTPGLDTLTNALRALYEVVGTMRIPLLAMAFVLVLRRRSEADKKLLVLFAMLFVVFLAVIKGKPIFYYIVVSPAADLMVALFLERVSRLPWRGSPLAVLRTVAVWGLVGAYLAPILIVFLGGSRDEFQPTLDRIRHVVPSNASLIGPQTYWFALPDARYLSWEQIVYHRNDHPGSTVEDAFRTLRPDYLLIDRFLDGAILDDEAMAKRHNNFLYIHEVELIDFLDRYATLVDTFDTGAFGNIRIYKIDWNRAEISPPDVAGAAKR